MKFKNKMEGKDQSKAFNKTDVITRFDLDDLTSFSGVVNEIQGDENVAKELLLYVFEKASKGFKNPDNIRYVKKCYPLDVIV